MSKQDNNKNIIFNKTLFRVLAKNRGQDRIVLWNYKERKREVYSYRSVMQNKGVCLNVTQLGQMLGRNVNWIKQMTFDGVLPMPHRIYSMEAGRPQGMRWDEDQAIEVWKYFSSQHIGRPRKDGAINNNIPSESEFRAMMNQEVVYYVQTENGFVPTWKAQEI